MFQFCLLYSILLKSVVHGHGRGKLLGTCLVLQPCASCVVSLQHVPMFQYASCERLNTLVAHGHGRGTGIGTCLVCAACVVATVVCVTSDGLFRPKLLPARKQDAGAI